jgi:hypothetical protein
VERWHVMLGELRLGDGSGWLTFGDAQVAARSVLWARREKAGCTRHNAGMAPCEDHQPATKIRCLAWDRLTRAMDAAVDLEEPSGSRVDVSVWGDRFASAMVRIRRSGGVASPGIGKGDKAFEVEDDESRVKVKISGDVSVLGVVPVTETARRGRTGERRDILMERVLSR